MISNLPKSANHNEHEKNILEFWKKSNVPYLVSNHNNKYPEYYMIDGPPFCNSNILHSGHCLISSLKSFFMNYMQMNKNNCKTILGIDCHGLPIEVKINEMLNIVSKDDLQSIGLSKYCLTAKNTVDLNLDSWYDIYDKLGRFNDRNNKYKTMDKNYMESEWWVFKELWKKNLIYKSFRILPYCIKCHTSLSNSELSESYEDIQEQMIYIKYKQKHEWNTYFLVYTTTPWTVPCNVALCLNPNNDYIKIKLCESDENIILSKNVTKIINKKYDIICEYKGNELANIEYEPHYNFFNIKFMTTVDEFVNDEDGTGIVHLSPFFGENDYNVCLKNNIISSKDLDTFNPIDDEGNYKDIISSYKNKNIFDSEKQILADLKHFIFKKENKKHRYPFCPRSKNKLIYRAMSSYFFSVEKIKNNIIENNKKVNWIPEYIGKNRFHNWLVESRDWNISRTRVFGTPLPLWESDDGDTICIGSCDELYNIANLNKDITDLHRDVIDDIIIYKDNKTYKNKGFVFDCWFDSGCVPYSSIHYPFENKEIIDSRKDFLCNIVIEGLDQTRGWFYTLMVISTALFNMPAFKNVICTGLILSSDKKKLSKRSNNYKNPIDIINDYSADSFRLYLLSSVAIKGESFVFSEDGIKNIKNKLIKFTSSVSFLIEHYNNNINSKNKNVLRELFSDRIITILDKYNITNIFDIYIISKLHILAKNIRNEVDGFNVNVAVQNIIDFIEILTNVYVRFNRDHIKKNYIVLMYVCYHFIILISPFAPFISEYLFQHLLPLFRAYIQIENISVHQYTYPNHCDIPYCQEVDSNLSLIINIIEIIRQLRETSKKSLKMPINNVRITCNNQIAIRYFKFIEDIVLNEVNSIHINYDDKYYSYKYILSANEKNIYKKYKERAGDIISNLKLISHNDIINLFLKMNNIPPHMYSFYHKYKLKIQNNGLIINNFFVDYNDIIIDIEPEKNICSKIYKEFIISIDTEINDEIINNHKLRLIIKRIQNIRKQMNLHPWNPIYVYIETNDKHFINSTNIKYIEDKIKYRVTFIDNITSLGIEIHSFAMYDFRYSVCIYEYSDSTK